MTRPKRRTRCTQALWLSLGALSFAAALSAGCGKVEENGTQPEPKPAANKAQEATLSTEADRLRAEFIDRVPADRRDEFLLALRDVDQGGARLGDLLTLGRDIRLGAKFEHLANRIASGGGATGTGAMELDRGLIEIMRTQPTQNDGQYHARIAAVWVDTTSPTNSARAIEHWIVPTDSFPPTVAQQAGLWFGRITNELPSFRSFGNTYVRHTDIGGPSMAVTHARVRLCRRSGHVTDTSQLYFPSIQPVGDTTPIGKVSPTFFELWKKSGSSNDSDRLGALVIWPYSMDSNVDDEGRFFELWLMRGANAVPSKISLWALNVSPDEVDTDARDTFITNQRNTLQTGYSVHEYTVSARAWTLTGLELDQSTHVPTPHAGGTCD